MLKYCIIAFLGSQLSQVFFQAATAQVFNLENPSAVDCYPDEDVENSSAPCEIAQYSMAQCSLKTNTILNFTANQACLCQSGAKAFFPAFISCIDCVRKYNNINITYPAAEVIQKQSSIICGASVTGGLNAFYAALSTLVPDSAQINFVTVSGANMTTTAPVISTTFTTGSQTVSSETSSVVSTTSTSNTASRTTAAATTTGAATSGLGELSGGMLALVVVAGIALLL